MSAARFRIKAVKSGMYLLYFKDKRGTFGFDKHKTAKQYNEAEAQIILDHINSVNGIGVDDFAVLERTHIRGR